MSRNSIHLRLAGKYIRTIVFALGSLLIASGAWFGWEVWAAFPAERMTLVTSVDPLEISSWDTKRQLLTVFSIPSDVFIEGIFGVGALPVVSLQRLETMDTTKKGLLALSLSEAFATPILAGDMPPLLRLRWAFTLRTIRPDAVKRIDLASLGVYRSETLPDGSSIRVFDENRFDVGVGTALEVDSIRREGLRVRVVNMTIRSGLGNRAARTLSHAGMVVIAVESEPSIQQSCLIHTKKELQDSKTATFIKRAFHCSVTPADWDERADVTVRLGEDYAKGFTTSD